MHDWLEEVWNLGEIFASISKIVEEFSESLEILVVLIGLSSCGLNFLLKFTEGSSVSGFVLLKELKHLLYSLRSHLITNGVQVLRFVLPEVDFS